MENYQPLPQYNQCDEWRIYEDQYIRTLRNFLKIYLEVISKLFLKRKKFKLIKLIKFEGERMEDETSSIQFLEYLFYLTPKIHIHLLKFISPKLSDIPLSDLLENLLNSQKIIISDDDQNIYEIQNFVLDEEVDVIRKKCEVLVEVLQAYAGVFEVDEFEPGVFVDVIRGFGRALVALAAWCRDAGVMGKEVGVLSKMLAEELMKIRVGAEEVLQLIVVFETFVEGDVMKVELDTLYGEFYISINELNDAKRRFEDSLNLGLSVLEDKGKIAKLYNNMGLVCDLLELFEEAIGHFENSLKFHLEMEDVDQEGVVGDNVGEIHFSFNLLIFVIYKSWMSNNLAMSHILSKI